MSKSWLSRKSSDGSKWLHPADSLLHGQVVYQVKLFGSVDASGTKGIEVVRDAMQKTKFNRQLLKADGVKCPKVELIISVDNVIVRNTKTKTQMHQFPLQQLSYCADDKAERRLFAFVARDATTNTHRCFVFDSDKCAEEITLTIGQAFELAYQKYLEEKPAEPKTAYAAELSELRQENANLRQRVSQLEGFLAAHGLQAPPVSTNSSNGNGVHHGNGTNGTNGSNGTNGTNGTNGERPRLGSAGSGSSNTEPEQDRYSSLPGNGDSHLLIESHSFTMAPPVLQLDENGAGKGLGGIPVLTPPPTVPMRTMTRSASADVGQMAKSPTGPTTPAATATAGTARPRPQPKLAALSETNPFRSNEILPPAAKNATTTPTDCLLGVDPTWSASVTSSHVAALADFDPLSLKTSN